MKIYFMFKRRNDMENSKYKNIAEAIVNAIGGSNNVRSCQHCVTRLRFNVYDKGLVNQDEVSKIDGVIGTNWLGDQFQAVIGLDAKFVYKEVIDMGISSFKDAGGDEGFGSRGIRGFFDAALDYVSTTMTAMIPIMVGAGLCKTIAVVLGPNLLKIISDTSDLYALLMMISRLLNTCGMIKSKITAIRTRNNRMVKNVEKPRMIFLRCLFFLFGIFPISGETTFSSILFCRGLKI